MLTRWQERAITAGLTVACLYAAIQVCECCGAAYADEGPLVAAVRQLQPALGAESVAGYAATIREAGARTDLDPLLLLAVAYRESSLHPDVARCRRTGARGEQGVMQVMPGGYALRWAPDGCDQCEPVCSIHTGARFLAALREHCGGSTWRWVAAYGHRRCPSEERARADRSTVRARAIYQGIGGESWDE